MSVAELLAGQRKEECRKEPEMDANREPQLCEVKYNKLPWGADPQDRYMVVPALEAVEIAQEVLREDCGSDDLGILKGLASRHEALKVAQQIKLRCQQLGIYPRPFTDPQKTFSVQGDRVKSLRERRKLDVESLARLAIMSPERILLIEAALVTEIPEEQINRLAEVLCVSASFLQYS